MATISAAPVHSLPEYSAETGGCSLACREMSCPRVDPAPQGILFASFAPWPGVCWLPFLPCTWGCFRLLFHEILGQKNLPILIWQAWDRYHFRAGRELGDSIKLLLEARILKCREVKPRGPISQFCPEGKLNDLRNISPSETLNNGKAQKRMASSFLDLN
ncbi:unnamed protein product [Rangifer tarandus platyrhynchus]|uniref:Uncharacterized protein n=1 Tax=Rangifer tarandus platyrhynchus TaxID=3082113 RepID=A0ABN8Y1A2_RANTA|nr:unnamed protein product [Rangifer tarandus platyrhynchus]